MYYGKNTPELDLLREQYEEIFGDDPNGDMELEFGEKDYRRYCKILKECIKTGRYIYKIADC